MNNKQLNLLILSIFVIFLVIILGLTYQSKVTGKATFAPKQYQAKSFSGIGTSVTCSSNTNCNDNNACTRDLCKKIGTYGDYCVYEAINPCCGDGNCESNKGENCASCSNDCTGKKDGCITGYSCLNGNCVFESTK